MEQSTDTSDRSNVEASLIVPSLIAPELRIGQREIFCATDKSYYAVLRMFTHGPNLGMPRSLENIWEYLSHQFDMSDETLETLGDTLWQFKDYIETDLAAKGIISSLTMYDGEFVVPVPIGTRRPPVIRGAVKVAGQWAEKGIRPTAPSSASKATEPTPVQPSTQTVAQETAESLLGYVFLPAIQAIVENHSGDVKQAELKKAIVKQFPETNLSDIQVIIDTYCTAGQLFKHHVNGVAYIMLERPVITVSNNHLPELEKAEEQDDFDFPMCYQVLEALSRSGTHVQQKRTMSDLWRMANNSYGSSQKIPTAEIDRIKTTVRHLKRINIIEAGSEKPSMSHANSEGGKGLANRRIRSRSQTTFQARIVDQATKEAVQQAIVVKQLENYLLARQADAKLSNG